MIKQELIIGKIKKCCNDAIDCYDDCMFFSEEYDECIFRVLGLGSPVEWERKRFAGKNGDIFLVINETRKNG